MLKWIQSKHNDNMMDCRDLYQRCIDKAMNANTRDASLRLYALARWMEDNYL
jgi:hypothetical protein